jgi:hypothetical protein
MIGFCFVVIVQRRNDLIIRFFFTVEKGIVFYFN